MSDAVVHPLYVRITHWINAVAMLIMISSGWQIYNASPLFAFSFPSSATLGGWLAGGLLWHFAAMWLLVVNGLVYLTVGVATGHFRRKLLPIRPREVVRDLGRQTNGPVRLAQQRRAALRGDRAAVERTHNLAPARPSKISCVALQSVPIGRASFISRSVCSHNHFH
jgi:hypothetical protein